MALKLAGIIDWSWWWVLLPLWATVMLFAALIGGFLVLLVLGRAAESLRPRPVLAKLAFPTGRFPGAPGRQPVRDDQGY